jgi:hypothetical protein
VEQARPELQDARPDAGAVDAVTRFDDQARLEVLDGCLLDVGSEIGCLVVAGGDDDGAVRAATGLCRRADVTAVVDRGAVDEAASPDRAERLELARGRLDVVEDEVGLPPGEPARRLRDRVLVDVRDPQ